MLARLEHFLVILLTGALGAWMVASGLHVGKPEAFRAIDWGRTSAGMIIFLIGAWQFFRLTMAPGLPVYRWAEYFILVAVLGIMGMYFVVSSIGPRDWNTMTSGLVGLLAGLWAAIRKFPGRGPQA
jgi:uncharacterized membrane protein HdeD (DUF308 family)